MQRVLSFQMARGLSETSEFVTKRMCFSLIFSVGFLSLLCGFLLGRFATQRAIESRVEKKRLELAGNGLESTEYLQHLILEQLERAPLDPVFETKWESWNVTEDDARHANDTLSNLSLIRKVVHHQSYILATARGSREPDRYVILSANGDGIGVALKLAKVLNQISEEHKWKPRRSILFCLSSGSSSHCSEILSSFIRHRVVAYIALQQYTLEGKGPFAIAGSDVVQSVVLESVGIVRNWFPYHSELLSLNSIYYNTTVSRLHLDVPHAVLSFVKNTYSDIHHVKELHKIILAQILGETIWRLSESLVIKWNPNYLNEIASKALKSINSSELSEAKGRVQEILNKLLNSVNNLNGKIDTVDSVNTLDTRMLNDLLIDLDRTLLCPDQQQKSKTDWREFFRLTHMPFSTILTYINNMVKCYENAIQLLQDP